MYQATRHFYLEPPVKICILYTLTRITEPDRGLKMQKTWEIRDQLPNGTWSEPRTVTLEQFKAESARKAKAALAVFRASVESVEQANH